MCVINQLTFTTTNNINDNLILIKNLMIFEFRLNSSKGLRDKTTLNLQNESDGSVRDPDEEIIDCLKDRKIALEDKSVS